MFCLRTLGASLGLPDSSSKQPCRAMQSKGHVLLTTSPGPIPFRKMPRAITRKYRSGLTTVRAAATTACSRWAWRSPKQRCRGKEQKRAEDRLLLRRAEREMKSPTPATDARKKTALP